MLERYFVNTSTVDRILANWLAAQIERYGSVILFAHG
jgi:hypothetical protein